MVLRQVPGRPSFRASLEANLSLSEHDPKTAVPEAAGCVRNPGRGSRDARNFTAVSKKKTQNPNRRFISAGSLYLKVFCFHKDSQFKELRR
jgi:hypothetical protein